MSGIKLGSYVDENDIINGMLDFWQRDTGVAVTISGTVNYGPMDRFWTQDNNYGNGHDATIEKVSGTIDGRTVNAMRLEVTAIDTQAAPSSDFRSLGHRIEGYNWSKYIGEKAFLTFKARSNKTGKYQVMIRAGGSGTKAFVAEYTLDVVDQWKTIKIPIDTVPTDAVHTDLESGIGIEILWNFIAGPNRIDDVVGQWSDQTVTVLGVSGMATLFDTIGNYVEIAEIQLNRGTQPAPRRRAGNTIQEELAMCQRYYWQTDQPYGGGSTGAFAALAAGRITFDSLGDGDAVVHLNFPTTMRVRPAGSQAGSLRLSGFTNYATVTTPNFGSSGSQITNQAAGVIYFNVGYSSEAATLGGRGNATGDYLAFDAEL